MSTLPGACSKNAIYLIFASFVAHRMFPPELAPEFTGFLGDLPPYLHTYLLKKDDLFTLDMRGDLSVRLLIM